MLSDKDRGAHLGLVVRSVAESHPLKLAQLPQRIHIIPRLFPTNTNKTLG